MFAFTQHIELAASQGFSGIHNEFAVLARLVGKPFHHARDNYKHDTAFGVADTRRNLERIAREHLGTAAVAVLHGVVTR